MLNFINQLKDLTQNTPFSSEFLTNFVKNSKLLIGRELLENEESLSERKKDLQLNNYVTSNTLLFDVTPSETMTSEEAAGLHPYTDEHLRRTNPKRYDFRQDWYEANNEHGDDSSVSNRYDNSIPLQTGASLKFSWQFNDYTEFKELLDRKGYSYEDLGYELIINYRGEVYLPSLNTLPDNIKFNNGRNVFLPSLTTLPENAKFNNKRNIYLNSLTTLPENIQFNNEGNIYLPVLISLPENKYEIFHNDGKVYYNWNGGNYKEFNPYERNAGLKFGFNKSLKEVKNIQLQNGNWNYDSYMWGMANGLILADNIVNQDSKEIEPDFISKEEFSKERLDRKISFLKEILENRDWEIERIVESSFLFKQSSIDSKSFIEKLKERYLIKEDLHKVRDKDLIGKTVIFYNHDVNSNEGISKGQVLGVEGNKLVVRKLADQNIGLSLAIPENIMFIDQLVDFNDVLAIDYKKESNLKFSWRIFPDYSKLKKVLNGEEYSYKDLGSELIINHKGNVDLSLLRFLPDNIQFNNEGNVHLESLQSLPNNIQFDNAGDVHLSSLFSLPENIQFNNEGDVFLYSLRSLSNNKYEIFLNKGVVYYDWDDRKYKEFNPHERNASLKFSSESFNEYKERNKEMFRRRYNKGRSGGNIFWSSDKAQRERFEALVKIGDLNNKSLLDVGCGYGDLYDFIKEKGIKLKSYTGIDIVPEILRIAKEKHPEINFQLFDITKSNLDERFDYVMGSGIFALQSDKWEEFMITILKKMFELCTTGVGINYLSSSSNFKSKDLHYSNSKDVKNLIKENIKNCKIKVLDKYLLDDYTLFIYKR